MSIDVSTHLVSDKGFSKTMMYQKTIKQWLDPFQFIGKSPNSLDEQSIQKASKKSSSEKSSRLGDPFFEHLSSTQIQVAAWLDLMDHSKRTLQGTYAVRITTNRDDTSEKRVILRTAHTGGDGNI